MLGSDAAALVEAVGEAAFYGPKLDLQVRDGRGQEETIATVQLDFNQPERFNLTYRAADGSRQRVVMIHRGTVGAMERVVAALLERYQGRLPFWLAPLQVVVLPVSEAQDGPARATIDALRAAGSAPNPPFDGSLGARIRDARRRRASLLAVIGEREAAAGLVQITDGNDNSRHTIPLDHLATKAANAHTHRTTIRW